METDYTVVVVAEVEAHNDEVAAVELDDKDLVLFLLDDVKKNCFVDVTVVVVVGIDEMKH